MKNNILYRFSINDLKIHKKDTLVISFTVFIISCIVMMMTLLTPLIHLQTQKENGTYNYSYEYLRSDENKRYQPEDLLNLTLIEQGQEKTIKDFPHCFLFTCGTTLNDEIMFDLQGDASIMATVLSQGRMPKNENELAVKETVLQRWGYDVQVNQSVTIAYIPENDDQDVIVKSFDIVGLLQESGMSEIVVSSLSHNQSDYSLYIKTHQDIENANDYGIEECNHLMDDVLGETWTLTMIQILIFIITFAIIYGLTVSSFEKKQKDYTLLRSIGATQRQIYYVIALQTIFLSVIPIILAMGLVYIISLLLPLLMTLPLTLSFSLSQMLWSAFIVLCISFMSYFLPAHSVTRKALTGSFDGQEFQYFYYQYKKRHNLHPFYLAWRQLISSKKKIIIKIVLIMIMTIIAMRIPGYIYINHETNQNNQSSEIVFRTAQYKTQKEMEKDFTKVMPYVSQMQSYRYISESDLNEYYFNQDIIDDSYEYIPSIYYDNNQLKDEYQYQAMDEGDIILSQNYLDHRGIDENIKTIRFIGKEYHVIDVIDYPDNMVILNQKDYQKQCLITPEFTYSETVLSFNDRKQRTQFLLDYAKDIAQLQKEYSYAAFLIIQPREEHIFTQTNIQRMILIVSMAIIYIYQMYFELYKQREDIGSYQLLGMTHREIESIYIYQSLIMIVIGFILGMIYNLLDLYYTFQSLYELQYVLSFDKMMIVIVFGLMIICIVFILSVLPLKRIVKNDAFTNKNVRE